MAKWEVVSPNQHTTVIGNIAGTVIGCLDHHLERRHALEVTKAFVKNAHGDTSTAAREAFKEVYRDFEDWSRSE